MNLRQIRKLDGRFVRTHKIPKGYSLYLQRTFSNFRLTLVNAYKKVVSCHTSGSAGIKGRKKYKISQKVVENILNKFVAFFIYRKIRKINVVVYGFKTPGLQHLINCLLSFNIIVRCIDVQVLKSHNGVRKRKPRSI